MGFLDDLTGKTASEAANKAAADQYGKQLKAADSAIGAGNAYQSNLMGISRNYDPYVQGGQSAYQRLLSGLGLGGDGSDFTAAYRALPGYQAGLDTGSRAVTSRLNAGPGVQSGAAMKALQRFGSDYEDQRATDYLTRLAGLGTQGLAATGAQTGVQQQGYTGQLQGGLQGAQMQYGAAPTIGQGMVAGANAEAAGTQNLLNFGGNIFGKLMGGGFGSSFGGK